MSAELFPATGNNASPQDTTIGGSKPLHRFMKGQPKNVGVIVLVLGSGFFIISISLRQLNILHSWAIIPPGLLLGTLFITCGILFIVTEHNPTKKTVTASLALSIMTLLGSCWTILHLIPSVIYTSSYKHYEILEDNITETEDTWSSSYEAMGLSLESIYLFYSFVGLIILIIMSALAGSALRSSKSQAIVVMSTMATETPVE
ncbi:uncharacterized protein LOC119017582 [Acanthopagrus latus]|uniref:uncharacterized protein LOC119017582 n=1 Tax=Acanthopagrus latus TaxID=8177 RepID=UPI00187C3246|nr:uncharacterized protein LOC119017582 [Acanthopagrus latus]